MTAAISKLEAANRGIKQYYITYFPVAVVVGVSDDKITSVGVPHVVFPEDLPESYEEVFDSREDEFITPDNTAMKDLAYLYLDTVLHSKGLEDPFDNKKDDV